jgi:mono/diheme cytochrome c family protein
MVALASFLPACSSSASSASSSDNDAAASAAPADSSAPAAAASTAAVAQNGASANDGAGVYSANCSSCHQATGAGLPGAFPPLAKNPVVTGDPTKVIHIVKYGLTGKIVAEGQSFNGVMPAWGQNLSDAQIASVITYVRSSWGNKASAVTAADVTAVAK